MSNPRQEGPSTGLVAAAVLFVAFAAKDLLSEDTPGADGDGGGDGHDVVTTVFLGALYNSDVFNTNAFNLFLS